MQREHVLMFSGEDLVTDAQDQIVPLLVEAGALVIGDGGGALQYRVGADHLARHQVVADAEILQRALSLCAPQPLGGDRKSTRLNSSHMSISYAVFCLKKKITRKLSLWRNIRNQKVF